MSLPRVAAIVVGRRKPRVYLDRLIVISNGAIEICYALTCLSPLEVRQRVTGIKYNSGVILDNRCLQVALHIAGITPVEVGHCGAGSLRPRHRSGKTEA